MLECRDAVRRHPDDLALQLRYLRQCTANEMPDGVSWTMGRRWHAEFMQLPEEQRRRVLYGA